MLPLSYQGRQEHPIWFLPPLTFALIPNCILYMLLGFTFLKCQNQEIFLLSFSFMLKGKKQEQVQKVCHYSTVFRAYLKISIRTKMRMISCSEDSF